ncbi:hypothetical protein KL86SPO_50143 [uncultured Sporomusa sp.]|uniref:Uncharacterized protein n=1 Tax=uncultured Sporomusa sp. TaxID=307249 RepID=A0A212LXW9_9FIRM|nr:hypothetical protein [uncultured Sporomusa sp.]SCM82372.1 hypothetical protein KL86SPO_50143 [uncultured Sporomusa sp.]
MNFVYKILLGIAFWWVFTFILGAIWSILHLPYNSQFSNLMDLFLLAPSLWLSWRLNKKTEVKREEDTTPCPHGIKGGLNGICFQCKIAKLSMENPLVKDFPISPSVFNPDLILFASDEENNIYLLVNTVQVIQANGKEFIECKIKTQYTPLGIQNLIKSVSEQNIDAKLVDELSYSISNFQYLLVDGQSRYRFERTAYYAQNNELIMSTSTDSEMPWNSLAPASLADKLYIFIKTL